MRRLLLLALLAACSKGGGSKASTEVTGTVVIDGKPQTITRCEVESSLGDLELRLRLSGGTLTVTHDDEVHVTDERDGFLRGDQYPCKRQERSLIMGMKSGETYMHGRMVLDCARGTSAVTANLTLACGKVDEAERAKLVAQLAEFDQQLGVRRYDTLSRETLNQFAVRENLPLFWIADRDDDNQIDPDEVAALRFYPTSEVWVENGAFTPAFGAAYDQIVAATAAPAPAATDDELRRRELVAQDLDQGRATLVRSDLTALSADDKAFVQHMLEVADLIDVLYDLQTGALGLAARVGDDRASQSLFRRNRGPACIAPLTEQEPACSAILGAPKPLVGVYPEALQASDDFCKTLEARKDADALLDPFVAVRGDGDALEAVPYSQAFDAQMKPIAVELEAAADAIKDPAEQALVAYLRAAAKAFRDNDWFGADEAWAKMSGESSKWYVRVGPDETYWEPCARKAGFHLTFARIDPRGLEWQRELRPVRQAMEAAIAKLAGAPYKARKASFQLPDFIDIIVNAGDDRSGLSGTIGQSLPNVGPVAKDNRGRTVAMSNLFVDVDSVAADRAEAESLLDADSAAGYTDAEDPRMLSVILHEAAHNLGPSHQYAVAGMADEAIFGGPLAATLEELKAETAAMYLVQLLLDKQLVTSQLANQALVYAITWAFGHIADGMFTATGEPKAYSQLAAVQLGFLAEHGALTWDDSTSVYTIHRDKLPAVVADLMKVVAGIKARGDKAAAEALVDRYITGPFVPMKTITERVLRAPEGSLVYSVEL